MNYRGILPFIAVIAAATVVTAGDRQAPPVNPPPPEAVVAETLPLDDAPAPAHRGLGADMAAPEIGRAPEAGTVVDLRLVPRAAPPEPSAPPRAHLQGQ